MLCRTLIPGSAGRIDQCLSMRRALGEEIMFSIADTHVARRSALRGTTALGALGMALLTAAPAWAQTAGTAPAVTAVAQDDPQAAPQDQTESGDLIVVTGFRASLASSVNIKRNSNQIVDAITAEDIADFPDANLAESIQRLPGVSIDRDNGEGRTITVRGLGGDFQMVRLNGADAQNISGGNQSDAGANRSRGFDFNTFASELFSSLKVQKRRRMTKARSARSSTSPPAARSRTRRTASPWAPKPNIARTGRSGIRASPAWPRCG
jgi:TonB-dependent Receptor Plug Domain